MKKEARQLDADDRKKVLDESTKCSHPLEVSDPKLYIINNGQKASADVNVHHAVYIGNKQSQAFAAVNVSCSTWCQMPIYSWHVCTLRMRHCVFPSNRSQDHTEQ